MQDRGSKSDQVIKLKLRCDSVQYYQYLLGICYILGPMINAEDTKISKERFPLGNPSINTVDTVRTGTWFLLFHTVSHHVK